MNEIKKINEELSDKNEKLEEAYLSTIQTLRYTVEAKDTYTRGHSDRVSQYSVLIGKHLGLSDKELHELCKPTIDEVQNVLGCDWRIIP